MRSFILDTDIGVDCDDAAAIAIMLHYHRNKQANLLAITASSTREGATSTVSAICDFYGVDIPVGKMAYPAIPCDRENNYARDVRDKYGEREATVESVTLMRKSLANSADKVTLIAVGPLTNVCRLLKSRADEYSPLNGVDLVKEKVDCMYLMGGAFEQNYSLGVVPKKGIFPEWNILQDIESARYVAEHFPVDMVYSPHEAGNYVFTDIRNEESPVFYSMQKFAQNQEKREDFSDFKRMSWDPVTCIVAVEGVKDYYDLSPNGKIIIDERGVTVFSNDEQKGHYYLVIKNTFEALTRYVNQLIDER